MKKLLGILVLGLLWCNVGFSKDALLEERIPVGSTKTHLCGTMDHNMAEFGDAQTNRAGTLMDFVTDGESNWYQKICFGGKIDDNYKYFPNFKTEIIHNGKNPVWFVYENVNKRMKCKRGFCGNNGDGTLRKIAYSEEDSLIFADPKKFKVYKEKIKEKAQKRKEMKIAEEKKRKEIETAKEKKRKEEELKKLVSRYGNKCEKRLFNPTGFEKDTPEFNNCLIAKQEEFERRESERIEVENEKKIAEAKRLEMEEEMLKNLTSQERAEYKCINTFEFRKGSSQYNECLFKLYTVELELEKMKLEHEVQKQRLALEREKLKTAQAQTQAARAQADAAYRSAIANENQAYQLRRRNAQRSINHGMRLLSGRCNIATC